MVFAAEAFGFGVILIANLTAIQGFVNILTLILMEFRLQIQIQRLRKSEAYLLVPWLFLYIIGIFRFNASFFLSHFSSSYIGAIIILGLQSDQGTFVTEEIFAPLLTGAVFHLVWILVRSIFNDFISGNRWRFELVIGRKF